MKKIILCLMLLLLIPVVFSVVEIKGFVNDYAEVINPEDKAAIEVIAKQIYDSGVAEYSVVTVNSLEGKDIEFYSLEVAQGNLGDSETNNGLLLLVALEDRKYRFEVGRGIEYILNDAKVGRVGRTYLVPHFQEDDYGTGIIEASKSIRSVLLGDNASEYYIKEEVNYNKEDTYIFIFKFIIFLVFFILIPLLASKKYQSRNKFFNAAMGAVILFGGRGRGGFGGGGFGGFGGGGFGGGGASGGF